MTIEDQEYNAKMDELERMLNELTKQIQDITEIFADGAWRMRPHAYRNDELFRIREHLKARTDEVIAAMMRLHKEYTSAER